VDDEEVPAGAGSSRRSAVDCWERYRRSGYGNESSLGWIPPSDDEGVHAIDEEQAAAISERKALARRRAPVAVHDGAPRESARTHAQVDELRLCKIRVVGGGDRVPGVPPPHEVGRSEARVG
jgi:hypothetical protein